MKPTLIGPPRCREANYGLFLSGLESPSTHLRGCLSGEPHRSLARCDVQNSGVNSQCFGHLVCPVSHRFRIGFAFGTGMVIQEHYEAALNAVTHSVQRMGQINTRLPAFRPVRQDSWAQLRVDQRASMRTHRMVPGR
jgi:hypothetical protein